MVRTSGQGGEMIGLDCWILNVYSFGEGPLDI